MRTFCPEYKDAINRRPRKLQRRIVPVTLRFADAIGEILTAGPIGKQSPLPFKYYI